MRTSFGWEDKGRHGSFHSWITHGCAGKTVKSLDNVCHTRALLQQDSFTSGRHIKYITFTFTTSWWPIMQSCLIATLCAPTSHSPRHLIFTFWWSNLNIAIIIGYEWNTKSIFLPNVLPVYSKMAKIDDPQKCQSRPGWLFLVCYQSSSAALCMQD